MKCLNCLGICCLMILSWVVTGQADTAYYSFENVLLDDGTQMTGIFSWTYPADDFENGAGEFIVLDIPHTLHDESDLKATIDATQSIEITFTNNVHDDGVDITLVLERSLSPTNSSPLVLVEPIPGEGGESKYEIGGNGFHTGLFESGSIVPTNSTLGISTTTSGVAVLSWEPGFPGCVLQETSNLVSNWVNSVSGVTNPVTVPVTSPAMFYRVVTP